MNKPANIAVGAIRTVVALLAAMLIGQGTLQAEETPFVLGDVYKVTQVLYPASPGGSNTLVCVLWQPDETTWSTETKEFSQEDSEVLIGQIFHLPDEEKPPIWFNAEVSKMVERLFKEMTHYPVEKHLYLTALVMEEATSQQQEAVAEAASQ